jgi:uncharacterized protein (TIGR04222 family)
LRDHGCVAGIYGALLVVAGWWCLVVRARVRRGLPERGEGELHPIDLAQLRAGPELAVFVAWLDLRRRGVVSVVGEDALLGRLHSKHDLDGLDASAPVVEGELAADAHPLEWQLMTELRGIDKTARLARERAEESPVIDDMTRTLERQGYLVDREARRRMRRSGRWLLALLALGIGWRVARGFDGWLLALLVVTLVGWLLVLAQGHGMTPAGERAVQEAEQRVGPRTSTMPRLATLRGATRFGSTDPEVHAVATDPEVVAATGFTLAWMGVPALAASFGFVPRFTRKGTAATDFEDEWDDI